MPFTIRIKLQKNLHGHTAVFHHCFHYLDEPLFPQYIAYKLI